MDGELGHESRDRVLAHLATCAKCKAEADAQRRLKNVFAEVAPPPPSESFLARLQGLPGGGDSDSPRLNGGTFGGGLPGGSTGSGLPGFFGMRGETFGYVPAGPHADVLPPLRGAASVSMTSAATRPSGPPRAGCGSPSSPRARCRSRPSRSAG